MTKITKYKELLNYFNVYTFYDDILDTYGYVTIDDIHDAIIFVGIDMDKPLKCYTIKAKQIAINNHNKEKRRLEIQKTNVSYFLGSKIDFDILHEYNFNNDELDIVIELLSGIKAYKSKFSRRTYDRILSNVKRKILLTL